MSSSLRLTQSLTELRESLSDVRLPLALAGAPEQASVARQINAQLDDYILPRLVNLEAPLLAVVGGSTGAGKSTLVNSLIGRVVSRSGVLRPTTRSPVLVFNPSDAQWFDTERILPGLIRSRSTSSDMSSLQLVPEPSLPAGLALLDAPDVDSVVEANRQLAGQLLQAADLWLFVTSAARYADAVPWGFLQSAADRSAAVAVVVDRIPPAAMSIVPADLGRMMTERGLAESPLFAVPETVVDDRGLLPDAAAAPIRLWLARLAADKEARERVVMQTLDGAIGSLTARAPGVATAVDAQAEVADSLRADVDAAYAEGVRAVAIQSADGTLLRGEVLSRWHDYVGTTEFFKTIDNTVSKIRDRISSLFRNEPAEGKELAVAAGAGLESLLWETGEAAAERAARAWNGNPAGRALIGVHPELTRASQNYADSVARTIRDWQGDVLSLVAEEGKDKRTGARVAAIGVNVTGAALMLMIFASTGGLTGVEVGVAGGATVLAQRLLESIFGDDAVRKLAETAKQNLDTRVAALLESEEARFADVLSGLEISQGQADRIRSAAEAVNAARAAGHQQFQGLPEAALMPAAPPGIAAGQSARSVQLNTVDARGAEVVDAELVDSDGQARSS